MSFSKLALTMLVLVSIVAVESSVVAQQLEQSGLKQQWFSHSGATGGSSLADWYLDIDENQGTTFFEIAGGDYSETFSQHDLGPNGKPMGVEFGLEMANIKTEVVAARLKAQTGEDVAVSVNQYTLPKSTLYTQTDRGIVRAYDAETGKIRWAANIGNTSVKSLGVVGKGKYVAVLKGGSVFCLDSETGAQLWSKRCEAAPSAPPQIDEQVIFVPLINGRVERFDINKEGFASVSFVSGGSGATTTRPAISPLSMCWANYSGKVSVAGHLANRGSPAFQLNTGNSVLGAPQYKDGLYFATSLDGYVYALSENKGTLAWENSTGFEISQSPILLGNYVYVINDSNELSRFEAKTGLLSADWQEPRKGIGMYAGASRTKLYTVDQIGNMKVLDQASGAVVGRASLGAIASVLPNSKTDRIYVLNTTGTIRCYREIRSEQPFFHADEFGAIPSREAEMAAKKMAEKEMADKPGPDDDVNPFGDGDGGNPFGDLGDDGGAGGDPFGGDGDAGGDPDDPFGDAGDGDADDGGGDADDDDDGDAGGNPFDEDGGDDPFDADGDGDDGGGNPFDEDGGGNPFDEEDSPF